MDAISIYWVVPFVCLLLCIALLPLMTPHFWEKNRNKAFVSFLLALPVGFYLFENHPLELGHSVHEYISFICLLGSLYIISGGIHLSGDLKATPQINTLFLGCGSVLASLIGTTGASMLLIRPLLVTNKQRKNTAHIPIFFLFTVSNIGGLLTPIGDPPLFLGFLRGVPFFWTLKLFPIWLICIGSLLVIFYFYDRKKYKQENGTQIQNDNSNSQPLKLSGSLNFVFLFGIIASVFLPSPYREFTMVGVALFSWLTTKQIVRRNNRFTFNPIIEVVILFAGIFVTMVPALALLKSNAQTLGISESYQFFWFTGLLSGFLDNAPTYLTFLSMAQGMNMPNATLVGVSEIVLMAISAGSVLMGALTYIGNGPNFMVKALADEAGYKMPSFFGYLFISASILGPLFLIVTFVYFV